MDEKHDRSLQERVERLEAVVAELQSVLEQTDEASRQQESKEASPAKLPDSAHAGAPPSPAKPSPARFPPSMKFFELPEIMRTSEYWLNKIGIGLVLFGVAFLFKYSIDQGWMTPLVRVGFGVILGVGLILAGLRMSADRRHFSQVLIGGGIATFYITGFATFQVLTLISHPVAFAFMVSVTLLAFILSLKQSGAVLALIGAIGGLGTPFLLYTGTSNLPGLIGYTCLVLSGTSAIFFYRGWRSLLWTSVVGGWSVLLVVIVNGLSTDPKEAIADRWALQLGIIFDWLAFWALPLVREFVWAGNPMRWHRPSLDSGEKFTFQNARDVLDRHMYLLSASTPLIALGMSIHIWSLSNQSWGWITLGGGIIYGFTSWCLSRLNAIRYLSYTHSLVGVMLLTIAFYLLLDGNTLLFALAAEAAILHLIARRLSDRGVAMTAHLLFGVLALWLVQRLFFRPTEGTAILNMQGLTDLWVIGVGSFVSLLSTSSQQRKVYLFLVHMAILAWFLRELSSLPHGQGYVTIAWGCYAVILLVLGLRLNSIRLRTLAMGTLLVVVGKLFLLDLTKLEAIWRVLLFLGFGGVFLILSYYFRALWKSDYQASDQ
jgi:uncharacterized membrane protein